MLLHFLITITTYAQKELWGVNNDTYVPLSGAVYYGNITKYDINGQNPEKMHEFNSIDGSNPNCKLFLASNGKIYGTTLDVVSNTPFSYSVFFEYDPILNKYRTISNFAPYIFLIAGRARIDAPLPALLNQSAIINGVVVSPFEPRVLCLRLPIKKSIGNPSTAPAASKAKSAV